MRKPVRKRPMNLAVLRDEYLELLADAGTESGRDLTPRDEVALLGALVLEAEWSRKGAIELIYLAKHYGHFFLRNATALAAAMDIEDGLIGY